MVRAIDRHESILQSPLTERIQQIQQQHPDLQQRYFEVQLSQEHRKMLQRINESEEKEPVHLNAEGERQPKDHPREGHHASQGQPEDLPSDPDHPEHSGHIDIKV
jgi:hypothetical protein